jgi:predicted nucleotidyltransferase component of viral defense system
MITEGYLARHYQGRADGRGPALIDIAQDHALHLLHEAGVFELDVVLKGGTAIRKFRAGNAGRFSTDLDFAGADQTTAQLILDVLHDSELDGFQFTVEELNRHRRARLHIASPFGSPEIPARIDLSPKPAWLDPELLEPIALPIHDRYSFGPTAIPTMRVEEVSSEKLARYRRTSLTRDLYDLAWIAQRVFDETLVRRLTVLKVWFDVIDDGLGGRPFAPADILTPRRAADFDPEAIGYLTTPVDVPAWIAAVERRFAFLEPLGEEELFARCSPGDRWRAEQAVAALASS